MSVGPLGGLIGSAAGAPASQTSGSEAERAQRDAAARDRQTTSEKKAEASAGIGQTEEDQGTSERDADGRRLWEALPEAATEDSEQHQPRQAKDPTGSSGGMLDLTG